MANKSFGIKELNLIGSSGSPVIESPTSLSIYATTVAISTNVTIGGIITSFGANISGVVTASSFSGSGSSLTGIVTSLAAGSGISLNQSTGNVTITATGDGGGGSSQWVTTSAGIHTLSNVGIGTTNPTSALTVSGELNLIGSSGTPVIESPTSLSIYATTVAISTNVTIGGIITSSGNAFISGIVSATSFYGALNAGQLTGPLPAIDGSALLNVTAVGTGVAIRDDNSIIGSASTINFGTGLDVTFNSGIATVVASGGSLQSRTIVSGVTTSIANNGIGNTNITGFKSYALMKVGLSTAGWLRLYTDSTSRANDASRSQGIDPTPGSGVIAEVVTTGVSTTQIISPFVTGGNLDSTPSTTIYAAITNLSGSTQSITANLTILQLEA
jgi:hypothetical protein